MEAIICKANLVNPVLPGDPVTSAHERDVHSSDALSKYRRDCH